jgi:hypothetical protein
LLSLFVPESSPVVLLRQGVDSTSIPFVGTNPTARQANLKMTSIGERVHSWPLLHMDSKAKPSTTVPGLRREPCRSQVFQSSSGSHSPAASTVDEEIRFWKDRVSIPEPPGSSGSGAVLTRKISPVSSGYEKLPSTPRDEEIRSISSCTSGSFGSFELFPSNPLWHSPCGYDYDQGADPNDTGELFSLHEATRLLPDEPHEVSTRLVISPSTGLITQAPKLTVPEDASIDSGFIGDAPEQQNRSGSHSHNQRHGLERSLPRQRKKSIHRTTSDTITKLTGQLSLLHTNCFRRQVTVSEPRQDGETRKPSNLQKLNPSSSSPVLSNSFEHLPPVLSQEKREPRTETSSDSITVTNRRLSVTQLFGAALTDSIQEGISLQRAVDDGKIVLPEHIDRFGLNIPMLAKINLPTKTVRFQEPDRAQHPSDWNISTAPRPESNKGSDSQVSLRGGCLPRSKYHDPPPFLRVDPDRRPVDSRPVPSGLWYLAGGRPVYKDRSGRECYHGQPKPKRRQPGETTPERTRNADPCQPLTFGHLRDWKQQSRPTDRLNQRSGDMVAVKRSFLKEFAYSASRGKLAIMRPKENPGASSA